jgi:chorismate mutase-like protein
LPGQSDLSAALLDDLRTRNGVVGAPDSRHAISREDMMLAHSHAPAAGPDAAAGELERLRAQLDALDQVLLDTVRDRIRCCVRIAGVKRRHRVPMMQPHRIAIVHQRAASYAAEHGVDTDFLRRLYDLIIDETCRVEDLVIGDHG